MHGARRDVVTLLLEGKSNREIGQARFTGEGTARNHVTHVLEAFGAADRTKLAILLLKTRRRTRAVIDAACAVDLSPPGGPEASR